MPSSSDTGTSLSDQNGSGVFNRGTSSNGWKQFRCFPQRRLTVVVARVGGGHGGDDGEKLEDVAPAVETGREFDLRKVNAALHKLEGRHADRDDDKEEGKGDGEGGGVVEGVWGWGVGGGRGWGCERRMGGLGWVSELPTRVRPIWS